MRVVLDISFLVTLFSIFFVNPSLSKRAYVGSQTLIFASDINLVGNLTESFFQNMHNTMSLDHC